MEPVGKKNLKKGKKQNLDFTWKQKKRTVECRDVSTYLPVNLLNRGSMGEKNK